MTPRLADLLRQHYGLSGRIALDPAAGGHVNDTWIVTCDGVERFALRRYNAGRDASGVQGEHAFLSRLQALLGDLIAAPLPTAGGPTVLEAGARLFALFPFKRGVQPSRTNRAHVMAAGHALARVHLALWRARDEFDAFRVGRPPLAAASFLSVGEIWEALAAHLSPGELAHCGVSREMLREARDRAAGSLASLAPFAHLAHPIHADFGLANLLLDEASGDIVAILDWEEARWDLPLLDVAAVMPYYDAGFAGGGQCFARAYLDSAQCLGHPRLEVLRASFGRLQEASYAAHYQELTSAIRNGETGASYIASIGRLLRRPYEGKDDPW